MSKNRLTRKNPDGPYIFISYSHKDEEEVTRVLTVLDDRGADFWLDEENLRTGDDWLKRVKEMSADKRCAGILYFISENFIDSDACFTEFCMLGDLKKSHAKFNGYNFLLGDNKYNGWNAFLSDAMGALLKRHPENPMGITERVTKINAEFNQREIYCSAARSSVDGEDVVNKLYTEIFTASGCVTSHTDKMKILVEDGMVDDGYLLKKTGCSINKGKESVETEWRVFSYSGDTISAVLVVEDEPFKATSLSFVRSTFDGVNDAVNNPPKDGDGKYINFDSGFLKCIKTDGGKKLRFLRSAEHEANYLQLKDALLKVPLSDADDDGYFFVQGGDGKILFADRGSPDVYRHIHVDAYASIIPVIDVGYEEYRAYLLNKNKA